MEIEITAFVESEDASNYSASVAELGQDARRITWSNATREAARAPLLTTEDQLQALRDHVQAMGFGAEVQGYNSSQCNALFIQLISGDMREAGMDDCFIDEFDWSEYQKRGEQGEIHSNIFRANDGKVYYTLSE